MKFTPISSAVSRTLDDLCREIREDHEITHSWRKTAAKWDLKPNMARWISQGYEPGPKIRAVLGLPQIANVVVVDGVVPAGSQSIAAQQCSCGQWFISNHPRRKRCFVCSPYRKRLRANTRL